MLFLWSRDPVPGPRTGPWLAWFATAVVLWRCRRRIANSILAVSPLRIFNRRTIGPVRIGPKAEPRQGLNLTVSPKSGTGIKIRVKRLCTGDGPHVQSHSSTNIQPINYRVTRSGRVYGKYHHKVSLPKKQ